ncbi:MAG: YggT family protein, partial [Gammaproteobacteria bacterium]
MLFVINTLFDAYILIVLLRILLQLFKANFYNPVSQLIVKITNPLLHPIQRVVSGFSAPLVLLFAVQCIKYGLISVLATGAVPGFSVFLLLAVMNTIYQLL